MPIAQDAFYIPDDIETGLATGIYRRVGSVVRYAEGPNKGQIVRHLQPIKEIPSEQVKGLGNRTIQFFKHHKKETGVVIGTTAIIIGYNKWKNREPKVVKEFRTSLKNYIEAIREGNMDIVKIDDLIKALEKLKNHKNYDKFKIQLTTEELVILVGRIYEYTLKLAEDNSVKLSDADIQKKDCTIINLENYLKIQKNIFKNVA